jgi:DNA-directed RNA polymerase specialized sigma24 family protein
VTKNIVSRPRKPAGWWTPEKRQVAWDMYVEGKPFDEIAKHFGVTLAAAARQIYAHKKEQTK